MTSSMIHIVALGGGFKCPRKIHLNTQCPPLIVTGLTNLLPKIGGDYIDPIHAGAPARLADIFDIK